MKKSEHSRPFTSHTKFVLIAPLLLVFILGMAAGLNGQDRGKATSIFDGVSLQGWTTINPEYQTFWSVEDSVITGGDGQTKIPANIYLHTKREFDNFEFRCLFRLTGDPQTGMINSGIQYRSSVNEGNMTGYQADIGNGYWGDIYDEHRRGKLADGDLGTLKHLLDEDGWNSYIVRVKGNHHFIYINGVKTAEYTEQEPQIPARGVIGFQLHSGGAAKVEFRDLSISTLD